MEGDVWGTGLRSPDQPLRYRSRFERRTYRRAVRRRQARKKLWRSTVPVFVLVIVAAIFLTLAGRSEPEEAVRSAFLSPAPKDVLLLIEREGAVPAAILMHAVNHGGVALGVPGTALFYFPGQGFQTIAEVHSAGRDELLGSVLGEALGVGVAGVASLSWADLQAAAASGSGLALPLPEGLATVEEDLAGVAEVVLGVFAREDARQKLFEGDVTLLRGKVDEFWEAAARFDFSSADGWTTAAMRGKRTEAGDGEYFEPDVSATRVLLGGGAGQEEIAVHIKNGSGMLKIAEQTARLLSSLGYQVAPPVNAEGFPDVELSSIRAAPDALPAGAHISDLLGVLNLAADDSLASDEVVLVLGKDFVLPVGAAVQAAE